MMEVLVKIAAVAVAGAVLGLVIRKNSPEMALLLTIGLAVFAIYLAYDIISEITDFMRSVAETAEIAPSSLAIVLKIVGVSIIAKIASDVCKDAGQSSVASGVELAASFTALYIAVPLFETVISMIRSLL